ncbi:MAG: hypothetical protein V7K92_02715 [Nostoc sp.]|uniref:hypothetical protein n=1 Tax=Nostoc sp. TaxID=1180 RepID=UPI002FF282C7
MSKTLKLRLDKGFIFWQDSRDFAPASTRQKKYLEGSPDEGGDSVATTAVTRTVASNGYYFFKPYFLLQGAHLSCLATAASEAGSYQGQKAKRSDNRQTNPDFSQYIGSEKHELRRYYSYIIFSRFCFLTKASQLSVVDKQTKLNL